MSHETAATAISLIAAVFSGWAVSSYLSSFIYRLPLGAPLLGENPYCDRCKRALTPRDLFPILSWLLSRGKCRYCAAPVPLSYLLTEITLPAMFAALYLQFGFSDRFLLAAGGGCCLVIMAAMYANGRFFSDRVLMALLVFGALYRTLEDGSIFPFIGGGCAAFAAGLVAWQLHKRIWNNAPASLPAYAKILAAAGLWLL